MDAYETEHIWPQAFLDHRVNDEVFANAYASIPDLRRAQLKSAIAWLYAMYSGKTPTDRLTQESLGPAGMALTRTAPKTWALILVDEAFASPSRLLAACLPALCAKVPQVAVVRVGASRPWPPSMALALELAGVENVFDVPALNLDGPCADFGKACGEGLVIDLGLAPILSGAARSYEIFRPQLHGGIGLWAAKDVAWDLDALAFAQPDRPVLVYGEESGRPLAGMTRERGGLDDFYHRDFEALCVPVSMARQALGRAPLVLTPGREVFWTWAGLFPDRFLNTRMAMMDAFMDEKGPEQG